MADIVIPEFMDDKAVDWLRARFDLRYDPELVDDRAALLAAGVDARGLIVRNRTRVDAELLGRYPRLEAVGRLGVGLDNIDTESCENAGVRVFPATGGNTISVAEYVITAMLVLRRGAWMGSARVLGGEWPRQEMMGREVFGATLGLVGFGAIAQAVAARARAFGIEIRAHDPFLGDQDPAWQGVMRCAGIGELLAEADAVSLHVPLTDATRNLIDADALAAMRPGAVLINTSRGGIVDETALAEALRGERIAGAALDVFAAEPLPAGSPLEGAPGLIATPHVAGVTHESNTRISWITVENVAGALEEKP